VIKIHPTHLCHIAALPAADALAAFSSAEESSEFQIVIRLFVYSFIRLFVYSFKSNSKIIGHNS